MIIGGCIRSPRRTLRGRLILGLRLRSGRRTCQKVEVAVLRVIRESVGEEMVVSSLLWGDT
jgi:hypothetical protein